MAELHRCHDGELISHHSVQVTTTAPIPTNDIMVLPGIYYNLGKTIILLVDLKRTISLLESWHGGNLTYDFLFLRQAQEERSSVQKLFNHFMFAELILVRISRISSCCINLDGRPTHVQRTIFPPVAPARKMGFVF
jgi:hypothetical protein